MNSPAWMDAVDRAAADGHRSDGRAASWAAALARASSLRPLELGEVALLLCHGGQAEVPATSTDSTGGVEDLFAVARGVRAQVFGSRIGLFAPLYYSNVCANDCVYCGFRRSLGGARRHRLSPEEVAGEARILVAQGHRRILLIASEDPSRRGLGTALEAARAAQSAGPAGPGDVGLRLSAEIAPRSTEEFARLAAAGVTDYILFQETYDASLYPALHPSGPKADYAARLLGPERAAAGGLACLGLGVLYGLADPVRDTLALVAHARHLELVTGRPTASVSAPRLEPAEGVPFTQHPPHRVGDDLWLRIVAVLRLALPYTDVIVSTREGVGLRHAALRAGATVFSAGSRTNPGGYGDPEGARSQFRVGDSRSLAEVVADLCELGYEPRVDYGAPRPSGRVPSPGPAVEAAIGTQCEPAELPGTAP